MGNHETFDGCRRLRSYGLILGYHLCLSVVVLVTFIIGLLHKVAGISTEVGNAILAIIPYVVVLVAAPVGIFILILSLKYLDDWKIWMPSGTLLLSAVLLVFDEGMERTPHLDVGFSISLAVYMMLSIIVSLRWFLRHRETL